MKFDRNTVIGFVALALLFLGYFIYTSKEQRAFQAYKAQQDSIAAAKMPKIDPAIARRDSLQADSLRRLSATTGFVGDTTATEHPVTVSNNVMTLTFSNKGGQPRGVELKGYKAPDSSNVKLAATAFDKLSYEVKSGSGTTKVDDLYFTGGTVDKTTDGTQTVTYKVQTPGGGSLVHQFVIKPNDYMVDFNLQVGGANQLLQNGELNLTWQNRAVQAQRDLAYEKQQSFIEYREDGDFDNKNIGSGDEMNFSKPVNWIAVKQQFFNTTFIAKEGFRSGNIDWTVPATTDTADKTIVSSIAHLKLKLPSGGTAPLAFYYGPTDYKILKQYGNDMENMVNLGSGIFAFVKYINRWIILPVWDLFKKLTANYGIVILLLTLFIRLLTSPLMYPSYLTSAKMRILRPELEELKKKYPDQQAYAMEQMKFTREAGVSQLAGCLPGLLQIPIFFALYSFFNSNVDLRGKAFLWAPDLSQYDSIVNFGFNVPALGNHLSLFTITAVITSFFISLYSMRSQPAQDNPVMKYMPYFFPVIMLFIFNKLPAALTWYYTVSNIITLAIQFTITNYIIDHDKVMAKIEANRKAPKKVNKWQERMAQMQEQQKKMQEQQRKGR
ncbi:MAG: yidC [Flaviaesturariibacter sp.]|nr:yidC [Flaviaesturariibacter sp.]